MERRIKEMWVDALTSGEYQQGRHRLASRDEGGPMQYCCWGVLCSLAAKEGIVTVNHGTAVERMPDGEYKILTNFSGFAALPPGEVLKWAGIPDLHRDRIGIPVQHHGEQKHLHELNDEGTSFEVIAGLIDASW